jgi:hypothetical protein
MSRLDKSRVFRGGLVALVTVFSLAPLVQAVNVKKLTQAVIDESEEPFARRIYSYDVATDAGGLLHLVYSKPVPGEDRCEIIYATGPFDNMDKTVLESNGKLGSVSTAIIVDKGSGVVHASYIKHPNDPQTHLAYQTIKNGAPSSQIQVSPGGWHTNMQLSEHGEPIFLRENGRTLRVYMPRPVAGTWEGASLAPSGDIQYRLADFRYDRIRRRFHVTYGDNAGTHEGAPLHNFYYATSTDAATWTVATVDDSLTLWENEFWTSLVLDLDGHPAVSMYKYNEYDGAYNTGTSLLFGRFDGAFWTTRRIVGYIPGETPPDSRAGMGGQLTVDEAGSLFGAWDNSPDRPIDFDGALGNIAMDHSAAGSDWQSQFQVEPFSAEGYCRMAVSGTNLYMLVLGNHADAKLYLIHLGIERHWWSNSADLGNGWRWLNWFGFFNTYAAPWIFHDIHGWMYIQGTSPLSLWFWQQNTGWLWSGAGAYPFLWSSGRNAWLWYMEGSVFPRWFCDMATGEWVAF